MTDEPRHSVYLAGPITFALLILIAFVAIRSIEPPAAVDEDAAATEFSPARAMRDVREIAKKPHPLGSAENVRVREYLVTRLRELGTNPEGQTTTVARHSPFGPDTWAVVNNIVAKLPGKQSSGAVMVVAHYDSVPSGPGAGDDAASVAAILEAIRALKAGPPLRNDLIILFTDGEELGLLGAKGFVDTYPALHDIKVVLNFDMRGDSGPSMMFQTSAHNVWLVDQLAAAAPFPYATSGTEAVYKKLPNDTDLTVFLGAGMAGMNFAADGGVTRYHTALDNADMLDVRTLQHQGSYALSLARRFGSIDLNASTAANAVFFTAAGELIHYSASLAIPLAILVTILVPIVMWIGIRDGRFSIGGIAAGFGIYSIAIVVAVVEARGVWWLMRALAGWRMLPVGTTYGGFYFSVAADALIVGTLWAAYVLIGRTFRLQNLGVGALAVWTITDARYEYRDSRRQLHFHLAADFRDARNRLSRDSDRLPQNDSSDCRPARAGARNADARALIRCERGRHDRFSRSFWTERRVSLRLVRPVHRFSHRRTAMDRARGARRVGNRHGHQRQRGQQFRRVAAASGQHLLFSGHRSRACAVGQPGFAA